MMRLCIDHVSKSYGRTRALCDFCAELEPGIYALLGPNGSGKSTLMHILTDNLKADAGKITFSPDGASGEDVLKMGARFRGRLGFMPQYPGMYANFTVKQFMWYMAALKDLGSDLPRHRRRHYVRERITTVLDAVALSDAAGRRIGTLSGGMKQRLALAQAVLNDPDILILDEPTAGLDPEQRIAVRNFIASIALNKIVIFATHVVSDIEFIAKRIILLKKGKIIHNATPSELVERITGKVWSIAVPEAQVAELQQRCCVTAITRDERDPSLVLLRVIAEQKPSGNAVPAAPTLEDFYLHLYGDA